MTPNDLSLISDLFKKRFKDASGIVDLEKSPEQGAPGEYIPTGSISLNLALGVGGFQKGTVNEIFGPESSGKSTLVMDLVRSAQGMFPDQAVAYVDTEGAFSKTYAHAIGIDTSKDRLWYTDEGITEKALDMVLFFAQQGFPLVVLDSVAEMVPQDQMDSNDATDAKMGGNAKLLSTALPKIKQACKDTGTVVLCVNQVREKVGLVFGNPETTPGGRALKFASGLRVRTKVKERLKDAKGECNGVLIEAEVLKNKIGGAPFRRAEYPIIFGLGIDRVRDLADLSVKLGLLGSGAGGRYEWAGKKLHGKGAVYDLLRDNPDVVKTLTDTVWSSH